MESDHGARWPMTGRGAEVKQDGERSWHGEHPSSDAETSLTPLFATTWVRQLYCTSEADQRRSI